MAEQMRVAIGQVRQVSDERLKFARQVGVRSVHLNTPLPGEERWEYQDLVRLRRDVEEYGLRLEAIEGLPRRSFAGAMLASPERERQLEDLRATIRNIGRAGIPVVGYHFMPNGVWRTSHLTPGRGDARVMSFDMALVRDAPPTHGRTIAADEMWRNYESFIGALLPAAEESGVTLALHPDDPPVESIGGVARLFWNVAGFRRALEEIAPSPAHGLTFCMGCFSEIGGALEPLQYFGERGKIVYVHFRDVKGTVPRFDECFLGEGNTNVVAAMLALKQVGFGGFMIDDHVPAMVDDTEWHHRGRALATGYMLGLLEAVNELTGPGARPAGD
jgi:mannonate dehydratase